MQADYAVELGADDEVLEVPWSAPGQLARDGGLQYYDLRRHPELLSRIEEAQRVPELGEFLSAVNSPVSILETAKCDAWPSMEINPEEEIFGALVKFGSYVDLIFSDHRQCFSFSDHETLAKNLSALLKRGPEIPASADFLIRRCHYHGEQDHIDSGFYITFYLFGYDDSEELARRHWAIALKLVENAILQLSLR
jgi:hypothetical protein